MFTSPGEKVPGWTHSSVNLWLFSACHSLSVRNRYSDQFTALSELQAGRNQCVADLLFLGENDSEERLPQLILRKHKDSGLFSPLYGWLKVYHSDLLRMVPVYACWLSCDG